jgi:predicted amidohydrolase YtcJ
MLGLYAAVTRQSISGQPVGGWFPAERITIAEAIQAYTYNTAYANIEENIMGSIEPGKLADLTVLSRNLFKIPPRDFLETKVLYTILNGKIVYQRS